MNKLSSFLMKFGSGLELVEDYGVFANTTNAYGASTMELKLLKCRNKSEQEVYILEMNNKPKTRFGLGENKQHYIVTRNDLRKIRDNINEKILNKLDG